jgi:hypothetical protein
MLESAPIALEDEAGPVVGGAQADQTEDDGYDDAIWPLVTEELTMAGDST